MRAILPAQQQLSQRPLSGAFADWQQSAQVAMAAAPTYFTTWDTVKTGLLVLAVGGVAYQLWRGDK